MLKYFRSLVAPECDKYYVYFFQCGSATSATADVIKAYVGQCINDKTKAKCKAGTCTSTKSPICCSSGATTNPLTCQASAKTCGK